MKNEQSLTMNSQLSSPLSSIPQGYKQTEVGVIPEDWEALTLVQCSRKIADGEHVTPKRTTDGYYLLSARNIRNGYIDLSDVDYVGVEEYLRIRKRCNPEPEDVLISCSGSIGRIAVVPSGLECVMVRSAAVIKPDKNQLGGTYLQYALQSSMGQTQIFATINQGAQANLFLNHIEGLYIPLPPIAEQEAIAQALSDTDALLESLEQLLAKKRQIKQGAMQELLTAEEDWQPTSLENISAFITKGTTPTTYGFNWVSQGILFLRSECVSESGLDLSQSMFISPEAHSVLSRSQLASGDILMTITGNVGRVVHLNESFKTANMNQHISRIRINADQVSSRFVYHFLSQKSIRKFFNTITTGQAYPQISLKQVRDQVIPLPSFEKQTEIATILSDMDGEIASLETKLTKTRQLKQGMMNQLLTGKIRLVDLGLSLATLTPTPLP